MDPDSFEKQEIALALARAIKDFEAPREMVPKGDQRNLFVFLQESESPVDPVRLGERLIRELGRMGYKIIRQH